MTGTYPIDIPRQWIIACQREAVQLRPRPSQAKPSQGTGMRSKANTDRLVGSRGIFDTFPMGAE